MIDFILDTVNMYLTLIVMANTAINIGVVAYLIIKAKKNKK